MIDGLSSSRPPLPSAAKFGGLMALVLLGFAVYGYYHAATIFTLLMLLVFSASFACAALLAPAVLNPLNRLWFEMGLLLGKVVSPVVLGIMFFVVVTPVAWILRARGYDPLKLRRTGVASYWVPRAADDVPAESFQNQF